MENIFNKPILEQLYEFRKEDHDQNEFDGNNEIREIEGKVVEIGDELLNIYKNIIKDEKEWDKVFEKFREYELAFGEELNIWCKNHYMWGLNDMAKLKSEIKFITSKNCSEDKTFIEFSPTDFDEYIQHKTDFNSKQYKELGKKYNQIADKYPNVIRVMEDLEPILLNKEEMSKLIELREIELDRRSLELKLCFKLGMNEILNF